MSKLILLIKFELKKNLFHSNNWLMSLLFMLINVFIISFSSAKSLNEANYLFIPSIISSFLFGIVLLGNQIFEEDVVDGSFHQLIASGISSRMILISKSIALNLILNLLLIMLLCVASILFKVEILTAIKLWMVSIFFTPILSSLTVFSNMLTSCLQKNNLVSIILVFPFFISVLIIFSMAMNDVINIENLKGVFSYVMMSIGITAILIPIKCFLVKYLR